MALCKDFVNVGYWPGAVLRLPRG